MYQSNPSIFSKYFESAQQTITSAGSLTIAHGLGVRPKVVECELVCITGELGYTAGDRVPVYLNAAAVSASSLGATIVYDATNLNVRFSSNPQVYSVPNFTTGANATLTNANWRVIFKAFA